MPHRPTAALLGSCLALLLLLSGCASIGVRPVPIRERADQFERTALNSDRPSERTLRFLRQRDLEAFLAADPETMLMSLDKTIGQEHEREVVFVLAELCFWQAKRSAGDPDKAAMFYRSSAIYAYRYLFDGTLRPKLHIYHPYSRQAMDFYNRSLAHCLLYARKTGLEYAKGKELPWLMGRIRLGDRRTDLSFAPEEVESYQLAYEYEVRGLSPQQMHLGLGVPIAVVRRAPQGHGEPVTERFLPKVRQTAAATLFLRLRPDTDPDRPNRQAYTADLEIYDPMRTDVLEVDGTPVPMEFDLTTPLALMLQNTPEPSGLEGMMDPGAWEKLTGLYMLQPYDPSKIPVVFVHGLMSSPTTWAPMFNGLMGDPALREHYQFWFFRYPTGNPLLLSAASLRAALDEAQRTFDPELRNPAFRSMVVVGHSMGGLLTKTLAQDSGETVWATFSKKPLSSLSLAQDVRTSLDRLVHFSHRPYVSRVIFLATPHRGSELALGLVGSLGRALITLPLTVLKPFGAVVAALAAGTAHAQERAQPDAARLPTGVDSLSPHNPVLKALTELPIAVPYHSVIGNEKKANTPGGSDGVVPYWSSHLDGAASEKIVRSGHNVHTHPLAIREVRRILLQHLSARNAARRPTRAVRAETATPPPP